MESNGQFNVFQPNVVLERFFRQMDIASDAPFNRDQATLTHTREPHALVIHAATGKFSVRLVLVSLAENTPERKITKLGGKYVDQTFATPESSSLLPVYAGVVPTIPEAMVTERRILIFNALGIRAKPMRSAELMVLACHVDLSKEPISKPMHAKFLYVKVD